MCGIFGYLNHMTPKSRREIVNILIDGLKRLEYRGYDSAGIGVDGVDASKTVLIKEVGKVQKLVEKVNSMEADMGMDLEALTHVGIAHTRWATHGAPSELNCHPHRSGADNDFIVVHNGIVTNYKDIKNLLETKGVQFESDTDTEIIAKLLTHLRETNPKDDFRTLVQKCVGELDGAFALCFKSRLFPGECVVTRKGSPLLIGIKASNEVSIPETIPVSIKDPKAYDHNPVGKTTVYRVDSSNPEGDDIEEIKPAHPDDPIEFFFASDASAIIEHTKRVIYLEDDDVAAIKNGVLTIIREKGHHQTSRDIATLHMEIQEIMKGSFDTFMQKEIYEQPESLKNTMAGRVNKEAREVRLGGIESHLPEIKRCRRLLLIACGTSYHSAIATRQVLEEHTLLPVMIDLASDFCDRRTPIFRDDVCFFISQSGETADTLEALRYCKSQGALIVGITNTVGSTISRESHCGVHINAGPEIGVASTKAYTSQCVSLVMFALCMSADRMSFQPNREKVIDALIKLPDQVKEVLEIDAQVKKVAETLYQHKSLLILGRGYNYATALEAALKVKELTYMHSEGIQSGELKHGPLALVDSNTPMILFMNRDNTYESAKMAANQIISRHGRPIIVCDKGDEEAKAFAETSGMCLEIPRTVASLQGIISVIPMQLLSYHIAKLRDCNVDCPRNLAKSVTVK